jgi:hypothetical protein
LVSQTCRDHDGDRRRINYLLERSLGQNYLYSRPNIDLLQAFDNEVSRLQFLPEKELLISASKGKSIKIWLLPREWRDAKLVAEEQKLAGKFITDYRKEKLANNLVKAQEDSDDDDLAGWHLD